MTANRYAVHFFVGYFCAIGFRVPSLASFSPLPAGTKHHIGIVRVMDGHGANDFAFPLLERRLRKYLEGIDGLNSRAELIRPSLSTEESVMNSERKELDQLAEQLIAHTHLHHLGVLEEERLLAGLEVSLNRLERYLDEGPVVQKGLLAVAALKWQRLLYDEARSYLRRALLIHPNQTTPSLKNREANPPVPFERELLAEMRNISIRLRRPCSIRFVLFPSNTQTIVNGFPQGLQRDFTLAAAYTYSFAFVAPRFHVHNQRIICSRQTQRKINIRLTSAGAQLKTLNHATLSNITQKYGVQSIFLIDAARDQYKLYFYTPGSSVDPVPMVSSLRIAEVSEHPFDPAVPIATDAFVDLVRRHRSTFAATEEMTPSKERLNEIQLAWEDTPGGGKERWYNDWKVWAVIGGLTGIATVAYFVSVGQSNVKSQGGISVKLD